MIKMLGKGIKFLFDLICEDQSTGSTQSSTSKGTPDQVVGTQKTTTSSPVSQAKKAPASTNVTPLKKISPCSSGKPSIPVIKPRVSPTLNAQKPVTTLPKVKPTAKKNLFSNLKKKSSSPKNITVYSKAGTPLVLKQDEIVASGGEGSVYLCNKKHLIKIYKEETLNNPEKVDKIRKRITSMLIHSEGIKFDISWPKGGVFNEKKEIIGFVMPIQSGLSFSSLGCVASINRNFPNWDRSDLVQVALNFVKLLRELADNNIIVNDFNPGNFLVNEDHKVSFIDCDSFQFKHNNEIITSSIFYPSHTAPEILKNKKQLELPRNIHQVEFSAAIIVYQLLMCGLHPYSYASSVDEPECTPEQSIMLGKCPLMEYENKDCKFPVGNWGNLWSQLTYKMKDVFIKTFKTGHSDLANRASLADIENALRGLSRVMKKDPIRKSLNPPKKESIAWSSN